MHLSNDELWRTRICVYFVPGSDDFGARPLRAGHRCFKTLGHERSAKAIAEGKFRLLYPVRASRASRNEDAAQTLDASQSIGLGW